MKLSKCPSVYSVPCRLKVLYELVVHFASLGRYEVAIPLCRMALVDYEAIVGNEHEVMMELQSILAQMYDGYMKNLEVVTPRTSRMEKDRV